MKILNFLFPKTCINCSQPGEYLCLDCKKKLIAHPEMCPYCHIYHRFYQTCFTCRNKKNNYLSGLIIAFVYDKVLKNLIFKLKYFHKKDIAEFLAQRLSLVIQTNQLLQYHTNVLKEDILISYVPSHRYRKHFVKGYNPSGEIAKLLAQKLRLNLIKIVKKTKNTRQQVNLTKVQREDNLSNSFQLIENSGLKGNETIILVDDVTTTGSTLNEIAKTIKKTYPKISIWGAVLGRHNS
ncbi:MAG: phosphoribosyltransferase family protein [Candidatus Absconditicoccaceae bacterium]